MTLEEDYRLAKRIDELLCTEFDKRETKVQLAAVMLHITNKKSPITVGEIKLMVPVFLLETPEIEITSIVENYCLTMAEKKALREFGRFEELKRIYGEDE